jgi:hypothetical protein
MDILSAHRREACLEDALGDLWRGAVIQALRRRCRLHRQPPRHGMAVTGPDARADDFVPLLVGLLHGADKVAQLERGPVGAELLQCSVQRREVHPALRIELQLVEPGLVPKGVGDRPADLSGA